MASMEDEFEAYLSRLFEAATELYDVMIAGYVAEQASEALGEGGALYVELQAAAVAGAMAWYGMYEPEVYQRGYTMADPGNIVVESSISVSGTTVTGSYTVINKSPHVGYSEGFYCYKRGQLFWRPGGDIMQAVPSTLSYHIDIPQDVADNYFANALSAVM